MTAKQTDRKMEGIVSMWPPHWMLTLVLFNNRTVSNFYHVLFLRLLLEQRVT